MQEQRNWNKHVKWCLVKWCLAPLHLIGAWHYSKRRCVPIPNYGWMIYPKETINNKFGNNAFDWMKESAFKNGICIDIVFSDELIILNNNNKTEFIYRDKSLKFPDFVIMRDYNYTISIQLENLGIRVINSTLSMFNSRSKAVTAQLLVKNNVSTPKFLFTKEKNYELIHNYCFLFFCKNVGIVIDFS